MISLLRIRIRNTVIITLKLNTRSVAVMAKLNRLFKTHFKTKAPPPRTVKNNKVPDRDQNADHENDTFCSGVFSCISSTGMTTNF